MTEYKRGVVEFDPLTVDGVVLAFWSWRKAYIAEGGPNTLPTHEYMKMYEVYYDYQNSDEAKFHRSVENA